ncbi:MAG: HDIG domain-containing protein [Bacteroidia bacterium]|nr:HDIG domain-containing protein [Bacteroidia bacterium]
MSRLLNIFYHRKLRNMRYLVRSGVIALFLVLTTLIIPRSRRHTEVYRINEPWPYPALVAATDFAVQKPEDVRKAEEAEVLQQVRNVYVTDSVRLGRILDSVSTRARRWTDICVRYREALSQQNALRAEVLGQNWATQTNEPALTPAMAAEVGEGLEQDAITLLRAIYQQGFIKLESGEGPYITVRIRPGEEVLVPANRYLNSLRDVQALASRLITTDGLRRQLLLRLVERYAEPVLRFDEAHTQEARNRQLALLQPVHAYFHQHDTLIRQGELVDQAAADRIAAYQAIGLDDRHQGPYLLLGQFLMVLLITMLLLFYLSVNRPRIYFSNTKLSLILLILFLAAGMMVLATQLRLLEDVLSQVLNTEQLLLPYIYLAPACIVPIFISNFFDHRTGFMCNLLVAFIGGVLIQQTLEYAFVQVAAGSVVVFTLRRLRKRDVIFYTLAYVFIAYVLAYIAYHLAGTGHADTINPGTLVLFGVNLLITLVAYNLIYLFERIFGITSDLTYLELLDTNHPLQLELQRKAPGTFQHSLQVAHIAEATINEIGGNALLVHVGAMYHDIGKIYHAKYFIENNNDEEKLENPHNLISCEESTEIIISHVKRGVELGNRYHLPKEIIHFIETHHGTTRVEYFYRKYLKENACSEPENEDQFRYPGPLPFSKETAVVMIADSVEAASRSLPHPTPETLEDLVDIIIDRKIKDGQLENSNLTFKDITDIRRVMYKQLLSIYHGRIAYPAQQAAVSERS